MTDKEQIIIDGVDVKNCRRRIGKNSYCRYFKRLCSENNFNCVWKQLARKTQECEELRKTVLTKCPECGSEYLTPIGLDLYKENALHRNALKKIEEIVKINCEEICGRKFEDCNDFLCSSKNIIDIINKAKGEEKCQ